MFPHPHRDAPRVILSILLLSFISVAARAQGIGSHRGDIAGTGGSHNIEGRIISPTGRMPDTRVRITLEHTDSGTRTTVAGEDGSFFFNNLEGGSYTLVIDAGKDFEVARETVYIDPDNGNNLPTYNVPIYLKLKPEANPAMAGVPKPAIDLFQKAVEAERKNENEKAISLLNEAIAQHPQFALAHAELGMIFLRTGQLDKAVEELKTAQKALPDDPQIQMNYGMVLLEKKDYAEAEKQLRKAAKKFDKSAQLHTYLGVAVMRQRGTDPTEAAAKLEEAEKEFRQAVKLGGDPAGRAHYYLGGIYWARKENKKAVAELELYLKQSPKAPDAEQVRGTINQLKGKS